MKVLTSCFIGSSELQKLALQHLTKGSNSIKLLESYKSVMKSMDDLSIFNVGVIFLSIDSVNDINFEVFKHINHNTQVIIISSKPNYALKAFDYSVTDYLLYPFTKERFDKSIEKARKKSKYLKDFNDENILIVKSSLKEVKLYFNEIKWVEALGDYVKIVTKRKNVIVLSSMKAFISRLPEGQFLRIHKSYIVNLEMVNRYNHKIIEIDGYELPLSRTKNLELDEILNFT